MKEIEKSAKIKVKKGEFPEGIQELMENIFWKESSLAKRALEFLRHVKRWDRKGSPYKVSEWESYCTRKDLSQSSYHNMLKRLRRAGMVKKEYNKVEGEHEIKLSRDFSDQLYQMGEIWDKFYER